MVAIITGDIIQSQQTDSRIWNNALKKALSTMGENPYDWEIYRGDSFQLLTSPESALKQAFILKACLRSLADVNVRLSIGIGEIERRAQKITESAGEAFVVSGHLFDQLKKQTLAVQTPWEKFNEVLEVTLPLSMYIADQWTVKSAEVLLLKWWHPDWSQQQIAEHLQKKAQGNISEAFKRGGYDEIQALINYYEQQIQHYVNICS